MAYSIPDIPELESIHLSDARLFANRRDMIRGLAIRPGGIVTEVGVAQGDFSQFLLEEMTPETFVAIDTFEMHQIPILWGTPSEIIFQGLTHEDFYRQRFADYGSKVIVDRGFSHERLAAYPDDYFDLIYVDAAHDYENVRRDAQLSGRKVKQQGTIVFNDYVLADPFLEVVYGVVPAVNEFIRESDWRVVGFGLQRHMFCDIAVQRKR